MMRGRNNANYTNPCLTMHQPWASLLVYGIKRVEGRSWPSPIRGRLWIHAASKIPDEDTIRAMEDFYREIYALDGVTELKFPSHYPVSRLLGCVEVVGCVRKEELASWEAVPEGVRVEAQSDFCWLCEQPQKLLIPFEMRGFQGVYNLERKIYEAAFRGLTPVKSPLSVKFLLPNPRDTFSLKPGSISSCVPKNKESEVDKSSSLDAAIAGARAAATQFLKKDPSSQTNIMQNRGSPNSTRRVLSTNNSTGEVNTLADYINELSLESKTTEQTRSSKYEGSSSHIRPPSAGPTSKIFSAAVRGLKPS